MHVCRRTAKLPACYEESAVVLATKTDNDGFKTSGFSQTCKSVTICDGTSDYFELVHPVVKKSFKSTAAIRTALGWDRESSTKMFAVILEDYVSKGTAVYEVLLHGRMRTGYGKAQVKEIVRSSGTKVEKQNFFGTNRQKHDASTIPPTDATDTGINQADDSDGKTQPEHVPEQAESETEETPKEPLNPKENSELPADPTPVDPVDPTGTVPAPTSVSAAEESIVPPETDQEQIAIAPAPLSSFCGRFFDLFSQPFVSVTITLCLPDI